MYNELKQAKINYLLETEYLTKALSHIYSFLPHKIIIYKNEVKFFYDETPETKYIKTLLQIKLENYEKKVMEIQNIYFNH
jgi:hypothetical protein